MIIATLAVALAADGAPLAGVELADLARNVPACDARSAATPTLDFQRGCVHGACAGMDLLQLEEILGRSACSEAHIGGGWYCDFQQGAIRVGLDDLEKPAHVIFVNEPTARDADGLGIGSPVSCFLDHYADHTVSVDVRYEDGWLLWRSIHFRDPRLIVTIDRDGRATKLQLSRGRAPVRRP